MKRRSVLGAGALGAVGLVLPGAAAAVAAPAGAAAVSGEIEAVLQAYFGERASWVTAAPAKSAGRTAIGALRQSAEATADRLAGVRARLDSLHGGYRRATAAVHVSDLVVEGGRATATVTEQTDLVFNVPGSSDRQTYWADHRVELHTSGGQWYVAEAAYQWRNVFSVPVTQFEDELDLAFQTEKARYAEKAARGGSPAANRQPSSTAVTSTLPRERSSDAVALAYNYTAMVNYARSWAQGRNPAYPSYSDDCTSFISQSMKAGGWATVGSYPLSSRSSNSNWWNGSYSSTSSYTWGGAENWYWFARNSGRARSIGVYQMLGGDVLQYDFDFDNNISHTQICTGTNSAGPLMTQHGSDYRDKPLNEILSNPTNANAWKYAHRT
ncbi:amidase domain-containing protein [Micromonospora sp. NBC_00330]|uniref:amidase domain-containing protein n=1 Tax=Micromonospora sp. NBC_00330 TaxID=2903585 RepID=UPI002E2B96F7|nr:amidase domain-containing protein [Micromonospora sp. NBC_00330]